MEWKEEHSVGVAKFDADHQIILDLINTHLSTEVDLETVRFILSQLNEYTFEHFEQEETHMAQIGYPGLDDHRRQHAEMKDRLDLIRGQVEIGNSDAIELTVATLTDWWDKHILIDDMAYKNYELANS